MSAVLRIRDEQFPIVGDRLSRRDFDKLAAIVKDVSGIQLSFSKKLMLETRLKKRVHQLKLTSLEAYLEYLFEPDRFARELPHLIDVVTTNKTDFFREIEHFDALERMLVPSLMKLRAREERPFLKVWSAASSTGAEAYTIAMILMNLKEQGKLGNFAVLGTDICSTVIAEARAAIYAREMINPIPPDFKRRYLMASRNNSYDVVRIAPEIRRHVKFARLNLMDQHYPIDRDVDLIFLRNVLIYFDKKDQVDVTTRLAQHLRKGGYLVLGHAEVAVGRHLDFELIASGIYRRHK